MEIIIREIPHHSDEVTMGYPYWFINSLESDVISATAKGEGFSPLTAIARSYDWNRDIIAKASSQCNQAGEVAVLTDLKPKLLLVPATNGCQREDFLIRDLIDAANNIKADVLNFTHYGFLQSKLPKVEIESILDVMLNPNLQTSIRVVVWDIDFRFKHEMINLWRAVRLAK